MDEIGKWTKLHGLVSLSFSTRIVVQNHLFEKLNVNKSEKNCRVRLPYPIQD